MAAIARRSVLAIGASGVFVGLPATARADTPAESEIAAILKGRTAKSGGVKIDAPSIAENGMVVPVSVEIDSPMTEADFVAAVHIVADGNPRPRVASLTFTPECGKAAASIRVRLAQTQNIVAIAELSNGELRMEKAEVKVTIGGCGG